MLLKNVENFFQHINSKRNYGFLQKEKTKRFKLFFSFPTKKKISIKNKQKLIKNVFKQNNFSKPRAIFNPN